MSKEPKKKECDVYDQYAAFKERQKLRKAELLKKKESAEKERIESEKICQPKKTIKTQ